MLSHGVCVSHRSPVRAQDASLFRPPPQPLSLAARMALASSAGGDDDVDWARVAIRGTSSHTEKSYFRLTSAPDAATVRPEPVLRAALAALVAKPERNYWCVSPRYIHNPQCDPASQHHLHHVDESTPTAPHCL
jgi:hypothetical protein